MLVYELKDRAAVRTSETKTFFRTYFCLPPYLVYDNVANTRMTTFCITNTCTQYIFPGTPYCLRLTTRHTSVYKVVCVHIYLSSRHGPTSLAQVTHNRGSLMFGRELMISLNGDDKGASPAFKGLAVIQVAVFASGNDFQPKSVITNTSPPLICGINNMHP